MDNIGGLKSLIEDVFKKQNDSLESVEELSRRTDIVSSNISNLINSLQMVGNRQFAENRICEDNMMGEHNKNGSTSPTRNQESPTLKERLTLRSILLRAIQLVPDTEVSTEDISYSEDAEVMSDVDESDIVGEPDGNKFEVNYYAGQEQGGVAIEKSPISERSEPVATIEASPSTANSIPSDDRAETDQFRPKMLLPRELLQQISRGQPERPQSEPEKVERTVERLKEPQRIKPLVDRDRIADILKRYSLYDDEEDEDESD